MTPRINVFHLEDYKIIRDGIRLLLSQDFNINIVGDAQHGEQLLKMLPVTKIDVLILDIYLDAMENMNAPNGFEICRQLKKLAPGVKVLAHSVYDDAERVERIIKAGAMGFVSKKAGFEELIHGIKMVNSGKHFVCRETAKKVTNLNRFLTGVDDALEAKNQFFSKREKEVLELLAQGFSSREIAKRLFITEKTVESHRKNLVSKARVKNTAELVAYASLRGLLNK